LLVAGIQFGDDFQTIGLEQAMSLSESAGVVCGAFGRGRAILAIAEVALRLVFRRKVFWVFYALAACHFLSYFFGVYLTTQLREAVRQQQAQIRVLPFMRAANPEQMLQVFIGRLGLDGRPAMYRNFLWLQGWIVVVVLALAGALLIGQDYQSGAVTFYLAKAITPTDYVLGKLSAVAVVLLATTVIPSLGVYVQYGMFEGPEYFVEQWRVPIGVLGYGLVLTAVLGLLVLATAAWLRKTVPMVMVWLGMLVFTRTWSRVLVDVMDLSPRWRLLDLWNDLYVVGSRCLGVAATLPGRRPNRSALQPDWAEAFLVLLSVCVFCWWYVQRKLRAVDIVA
jgi:ABC-2 type transport system permease protein